MSQNTTNKQYIRAYIHRALANETLEAPDKTQAGGYLEAMNTVYTAHQKGSVAATKAWEQVLLVHPELKELVAQGGKWQFIHANELANFPPPVYLYQDKIVAGGLHLLYGASGIGKSFITLSMALFIAQTQRVLYVASEGSGGYEDRVAAWTNYHSKGRGQLFFTSEPVPLVEDKQVNGFILNIKVHGIVPDLIIIDTLSWCLAGYDENSAGHVSKALANCRKIQNALKTAILLVHHTGKNGSSERGSSALKGNSDVVIKVEESQGTLFLSADKVKDDKRFEKLGMKLVVTQAREKRESCVIVSADDPKIPANAAKSYLSKVKKAVLKFLAQPENRESGAIGADLGREFKLKNPSQFLKPLEQRGYLSRAEKRDPYIITEAGLEAIGMA